MAFQSTFLSPPPFFFLIQFTGNMPAGPDLFFQNKAITHYQLLHSLQKFVSKISKLKLNFTIAI